MTGCKVSSIGFFNDYITARKNGWFPENYSSSFAKNLSNPCKRELLAVAILSKRQKDILILLSKSKEPVTASWMARELGVSDRTIRNEIKLMQNNTASHGFQIESTRGLGYSVKVLDAGLFSKILNEISTEEHHLAGDFTDKDTRVLYILRRLLLETDFIKIESFIDEMFVSLSTLQNDLKMVKEILDQYHLKLINRPHYGSKVEGDEYMKRLCLSNLLLERNQEAFLKEDCLQLIDPELFKKIKEVIVQKVNKYKIEISDISLENLATHIAIACRRIQEGFVIEELADVLVDDHPFEKIVANEIIKEVEDFTSLTFPETEIDYIIVHLLGTKLLHKKELAEFSKFDEAGTIINCMLDRLKSELNWDFRQDREFIQALTLHIRPAMNRLRYKMNIRNPLLNDIKKKYPAAFEGAIIASKCIEKYLQMEVVEDEIAYIALHIGVALERMKLNKKKIKKVLIVCASGVGSAKLLSYRLQNLYGQEIEIADTINYYNLSSYDLSFIDLIISTVPIKEDFGVPVQVVNTFLEDKDIQAINCFLSRTQNVAEKYLHPSRIFLQLELHDKESVIRFLCDELYKQKLVPRDYVNLVLERESITPTCFGNLVAIPHPMVPITKETFWTVCTLKSPIHWHDQQMVQFVCLLNIKEGTQADLDDMYKKLISIIENRSVVQKIIKSKTADELMAFIK
ncbi:MULTISPECIES: BglG family transcription antiterminator [Heyndrickxia]|uniref:BglG family transcription antiterminator n=1 Tax=Heyndrickxia TaxID=2837504 RepID=UPI000B04CE7E|nr:MULTISPECIES: BglG family transcription antiterminator [Heyndrickxia]MED4920827.1 BglG family transcription antiterminator [Weizmannia sp. CD-2023]MED4976804.1 BglG family transcription antiterminator [Weizmannia sp. CD-2023]